MIQTTYARREKHSVRSRERLCESSLRREDFFLAGIFLLLQQLAIVSSGSSTNPNNGLGPSHSDMKDRGGGVNGCFLINQTPLIWCRAWNKKPGGEGDRTQDPAAFGGKKSLLHLLCFQGASRGIIPGVFFPRTKRIMLLQGFSL